MARTVPLKPAVGWVYDLILRIFSFTVAVFFREVQVRGVWRVPNEGSVILVAAPHSNQFVDSVILMRILRSVNRRISWLTAEKSFQRPFIGTMAKAIGAVPVSRAMDIAKPAQGAIFLPEPIANPKLLQGHGTNFMSADFKVGGSIYLPTINGDSHKLDIAEMLGPEHIILKSAPSHSDVMFQLTGRRDEEPISPDFMGSKFKVAPHVDQTGVYNAVYERLGSGGCIGIFPEGGSHDRTELLPLKAGIAIMALGALANGTKVTIVPVGLTYFSAHKFRSRAVIEFGNAVDVPTPLLEEYQRGKKREAVNLLMGDIAQALAAVTMSAPDFETLNLIHATRRLYLTKTPYVDEKITISLAHSTEINRRLLKGYTTYGHTPEISSLMDQLRAYISSLNALGLKDHQLLSSATTHKHFPMFFLLPKLVFRFFKLAILFFLTLPGLLLFTPIFILTTRISRRKTTEALAASSVKIRGHDVMATWKILIAAALAPLFYTYYIIVLIILHRYNQVWGYIPRETLSTVIILAALIVLPGITYAALIFGEQGMDLAKSLYPLVLSLDPRSSSIIEKLREDRQTLVGRVRSTVDRFGPDIFPDCDDISKWMNRGPRKLFADISPEAELDDLWGLDTFV